jgi:hypothetical protein
MIMILVMINTGVGGNIYFLGYDAPKYQDLR